MTLPIRPATRADARALAKLIDIAGEGIPSWLWSRQTGDDETPLDIGESRAARESGGFSYTNAHVIDHDKQPVGMLLSYAIDTAPIDDPNDLPAPIAPFVDLEAQSVGTWYINALAVLPGYRDRGLGSALLSHAEALAKTAGHKTMSIQVYGQNTPALRLYERNGYAQTASAPVRDHPCQPYYGGDVLLLMKRLAD